MENPGPVNPRASAVQLSLDRLRKRMHKLTEQNQRLRARVQELEAMLRSVVEETKVLEEKIQDLMLKNEVMRE